MHIEEKLEELARTCPLFSLICYRVLGQLLGFNLVWGVGFRENGGPCSGQMVATATLILFVVNIIIITICIVIIITIIIIIIFFAFWYVIMVLNKQEVGNKEALFTSRCYPLLTHLLSRLTGPGNYLSSQSWLISVIIISGTYPERK